jgi:hypothetical protein
VCEESNVPRCKNRLVDMLSVREERFLVGASKGQRGLWRFDVELIDIALEAIPIRLLRPITKEVRPQSKCVVKGVCDLRHTRSKAKPNCKS